MPYTTQYIVLLMSAATKKIRAADPPRVDTLAARMLQGNWMWTEAAWGGSYNQRGDIPLPAETIVDFWDTDKARRAAAPLPSSIR